MNLSIFGLGYVGAVSAACFANDGNTVVGVDISNSKVEMINAGKAPIIEEGIAEMTESVVATGRLRATTDVADAVASTDISLVCVGTPSNENGSLNLDFVERVSEQIGNAIRNKPSRHVIVIRSTMLPGTIDRVVKPALEESSGKLAGVDFDICVNPEFLREGSSIRDFYSPPFTLVGSDSESAKIAIGSLYSNVDAPIYFTGMRAAEMIKYACNCFHGLKVAFANEIGNICKDSGIDSHEVMEVFAKDTKLNLSPYYLKPGFAFGGSCLPKDLRALSYRARELDIDVPVLDAALASNLLQVERAIRMITSVGKKKVGFLGFAFKAGTDDLRESPVVTIIERLIGKGFDVLLYDKEVSVARLVGANKDFIENEIPHISRLMADSVDHILTHSEIIVIGTKSSEFTALETIIPKDVYIIDLVRIFGDKRSDDRYHGICW